MAINKYKTKNGEIRYKATLWKSNKPIESKTYKRKIDAEQWLTREQVRLIDSKVGRLKGSSLSIREFFYDIYCPNSGIRQGTLIEYQRRFRKQIEPSFGGSTLIEVDAAQWSSLLRKLKASGAGSATVNRTHAVASAMYALAVKWEYVKNNPLQRVDWEEEALSGDLKYWQDDELSKFLNFAYLHSPDMFPLYHFMYETGLRISEALAVQWDCINLSQGIIEVRRAYSRAMKRIEPNTKSGYGRSISVNAGMKDMLLSLNNHRKSDFVFTSREGEMLLYEYVRSRFYKDVQESGVPNLGIHGLRHTFASHFMMKGGNLYDLKSLMGHRCIETTMRYAHLSKNHLANKTSLVQFQPVVGSNVISINGPNHFPTIAQKIV